ncbi:MAG: sigma-70 family RNA polymerase sigma factor [Planctomycetes bacterium]|nr:sigma-70 family RNA polymerase sigma factor [Planctomycetota bacterium]
MDSTDKSLIDAHCRGDKAAFAELVRRHGGGLLGYLCRMTSDRSRAEDLFQETFGRVHEKAHTLKGDNFKGWLYRIARNAAINDWRKRSRYKEVSLNQMSECKNGGCQELGTVVLTDESSDPGRTMETDELRACVRSAVDGLPERQKTTLVLAYYQQMNYSQIANIMGCSTGAVKTHMFRAMKRLARLLPDAPGGVL